MSESYRMVYIGGESEITEKKSRFIATVRPVESEGEAVEFINKMKKKYWDATHNCSAFSIGLNAELLRSSDDGEPSGTAGRPILDVLQGEKVRNTAIVVSRYFGGTLLGTGGLVRAYGKAAKEGLAQCIIVEKQQGYRLFIDTDYNYIGKIQYILTQNKMKILNTEYTECVKMEVLVPEDKILAICNEITESTNASAVLCQGEHVLYGVADGDVKVF